MQDQAFIKQEVIDASVLSPEDMGCPKCKGKDIVLHGNNVVQRVDVWEKGIVTSTRRLTEQDSFFDVERVDCFHCNTTFHIRHPKVFLLERENLNLKAKVAVLKRELGERGGGGSANSAAGWMN